jgi:hypothetical protein
MSDDAIANPAAEPVSETDYVQLCRLVIEAVWRIDSGHADTYHELFVDDGELILPPTTDNGKIIVPETTLRGRQAIYEWGRRLVDAQTFRCIRHVCGNMRFVTDGDAAAVGRTILTVFMAAGSGPATTLPFEVGEDHDRFIHTEHGWRLASRRWVALFTREPASAI